MSHVLTKVSCVSLAPIIVLISLHAVQLKSSKSSRVWTCGVCGIFDKDKDRRVSTRFKLANMWQQRCAARIYHPPA
jgi:hypothetical protein